MSGRWFAIGDIHGCLAELDRLLAALPLGAGDTVVFVGDYVDRGPESAGVITRLLELSTRSDIRTVFLRGNHEDMWSDYLGLGGRYGEVWLRNGGEETLGSYGLPVHATPAEVHDAMPKAHRDFLTDLVLRHEAPGHLVVHAGIDPRRPLSDQRAEDLMWIREPFLNARHSAGCTVVFGHTPHREVAVDLPYKIGIDTGCVYGGLLTALCPTEARVWQVRLGSTTVAEGRL